MDPVAEFAERMRRPEPEIDLAEAALLVGAGADPTLDVARWLEAVDALSEGVTGLDDLVARLFDEEGFRGNDADYYDPENSFLHRVLERRVGIPITLSVVTIEVARRAGIELVGVGMPGHFLVREPASGLVFDPFSGGVPIGRADCEALFRAATGAGPEVAFGEEMLREAGTLDILRRILANLKALYRTRSEVRELEWVLRMRLAIPSAAGEEVIELAQALAMQGRHLDGAEEIERRAARERDPALSEGLAEAARALRARLN